MVQITEERILLFRKNLLCQQNMKVAFLLLKTIQLPLKGGICTNTIDLSCFKGLVVVLDLATAYDPHKVTSHTFC